MNNILLHHGNNSLGVHMASRVWPLHHFFASSGPDNYNGKLTVTSGEGQGPWGASG